MHWSNKASIYRPLESDKSSHHECMWSTEECSVAAVSQELSTTTMSSKRSNPVDASILLSCMLALSSAGSHTEAAVEGQNRRGFEPRAHSHLSPSSWADSQCNATTSSLQAAIDAAAAGGGGVARIPCGFHATGPLSLHGGVTLSAAQCVGEDGSDVPAGQLTLGACTAEQMHIVRPIKCLYVI